jgi:hypothetical protein
VLTDAALAYIRSEVGEEADEDSIAERYERLGDPRDVALEMVKERLSTVLQSGVGQFNVEGVYSEDNTPIIRGLQAQVLRLQATLAVDPDDGSTDLGLPALARARLVPRRSR